VLCVGLASYCVWDSFKTCCNLSADQHIAWLMRILPHSAPARRDKKWHAFSGGERGGATATQDVDLPARLTYDVRSPTSGRPASSQCLSTLRLTIRRRTALSPLPLTGPHVDIILTRTEASFLSPRCCTLTLSLCSLHSV